MVNNPREAAEFFQRGLAKAKMQDFIGAITDFTKAIELNPKFADAYSARSSSKRLKKDYAGARSDQDMAEKLAPEPK